MAALAMLLGLPYEEVFQLAPLAGRDGLTVRQLQAVATKVGVRLLSARRPPDFASATGILGLVYRDGSPGHWVVVHGGNVLDPGDATCWDDVETYLACANADWDYFLTAHPRRRRSR